MIRETDTMIVEIADSYRSMPLMELLDDEEYDDSKYYRYFSIDRGFLIPLWLERIVGKRLVFTINNVWAKYHQVDHGKKIMVDKGRI